MEFLYGAFEMLIVYIILSNLVKIGYALVNKKKIEEKLKERQKREQEVEEKEEPIVIETVMDPVCNTEIEKDNAYVIVEDTDRKYFCSWDCRQKYINEKNEN
ncbi:hypothetical protein GOQ27_07545 [Clostridium sp. D2Q-11]|uniref:TRASH domain-containing protein n=1 Tax=Anaeromonas frigoriresistens TaxID=2683708 RepID=A0A942Z8I7_9FIRM|nr:hypothetical protein [Anaeromonas frigoriresistens]MBS4538313.1 hypothetical protein [Anaeromonas frigoriresistens]